jgi:hypothetical protein
MLIVGDELTAHIVQSALTLRPNRYHRCAKTNIWLFPICSYIQAARYEAKEQKANTADGMPHGVAPGMEAILHLDYLLDSDSIPCQIQVAGRSTKSFDQRTARTIVFIHDQVPLKDNSASQKSI